MYIYIHTYIYIYIHTYIYTYIHAHTLFFNLGNPPCTIAFLSFLVIFWEGFRVGCILLFCFYARSMQSRKIHTYSTYILIVLHVFDN